MLALAGFGPARRAARVWSAVIAERHSSRRRGAARSVALADTHYPRRRRGAPFSRKIPRFHQRPVGDRHRRRRRRHSKIRQLQAQEGRRRQDHHPENRRQGRRHRPGVPAVHDVGVVPRGPIGRRARDGAALRALRSRLHDDGRPARGQDYSYFVDPGHVAGHEEDVCPRRLPLRRDALPPIRHRRDTPRRKYAGTKEAVKSALQGIAINLNATDMAEAALSEIEAACKKI